MAFENIHSDRYVRDAVELPPAADLITMLQDGETYESIAEAFDCHWQTVAKRVNQSGLRATQTTVTPGAVPDAEGGATPDPPSASPLPLLGLGQLPEWMERGVCGQTDPESFFPDKGGSTREAKAICATCPVAAECLDYALDNDERFGIWGGLSERERRAIKRALQADAGVVTVPCPRCDKTFENDTDLSRHARITHDRPPPEDLPCHHCDHVCKGRTGLSVHLSKSHPELRTAS